MAGVQLNAADTDYHRFEQQSSDPSAPAAGFWHLLFKATGIFVQPPSSTTVYFVGGARREIMVYAKDMWPSLTAGCAALAQTEFATNKQNIQTLDFDQTTQEHAEFSVVMPDTWVGSGNIIPQFYWTAAAGSVSETVAWGLQAYSYGDGTGFDITWGTAQVTSDTLTGTDLLHRSAEGTAVDPGGLNTGGRLVHFRVYRDVAADSLAADAKLLAIRLFHF